MISHIFRRDLASTGIKRRSVAQKSQFGFKNIRVSKIRPRDL